MSTSTIKSYYERVNAMNANKIQITHSHSFDEALGITIEYVDPV
jgi:hypothetical protein